MLNQKIKVNLVHKTNSDEKDSVVSNFIKLVTMNNQDFNATIWVDQNPQIAFKAIKNFRGWWSEEIEGNTDQLKD